MIEKAPILKPSELIRMEDWQETNTDIEASLILQRDADHRHYLKQFATWLKQYDNYTQYYAGVRQTSPVRRHDIPNADLESLLKEAGG